MDDEDYETLPEQVRLDAALARSTQLDREMADAEIRRGNLGTPLADVMAEIDEEQR